MNRVESVSDMETGASFKQGYGPDGDIWMSAHRSATKYSERVVYLDGYEGYSGSRKGFALWLNDNVLVLNRHPYYAFTDNLGSILCVVDEWGKKVFEASYDAWGKQTVSYDEIGMRRGYCGHDMYADLGFINMGGRLYDPTTSRFLSPDDYVQLPGNSQSYNRYSYCLNNPLKYVDSDGEYFGADDIVAMLLGGTLNLGVNLIEGNIHGFGHALASFAVGAVAGETALYASPMASAAMIGAGNSIVNQGFTNDFNHIDLTQVGMDTSMSMLTSALGGYVGNKLSGTLAKLTSGINNTVVSSTVQGSLSNGLLGFAIGSVFSLGNSDRHDVGSALVAGLRQGGIGMAIGAVAGFASGISEQHRTSYAEALRGSSTTEVNPNTVVSETLNNPLTPKGDGNYSVYVGRDVNGDVRYVGITKRPVEQRFKEHWNSRSTRSTLRYEPLENTGRLSNIQARIIEQKIINIFGLGKNGGVLYNKINSINSDSWSTYGIKN